MSASFPVTIYRLSKKRLGFVALLTAIRVAIDLIYVFHVSELFSYAGHYVELDWYVVLLSYSLLVAAISAVPLEEAKPSTLISVFLLALVLLPLTSYWGLTGRGLEMVLLAAMAIAIVIFVTAYTPLINISYLKERKIILLLFSVIAFVIVSLFTVRSGRLTTMNFNLADVYQYRGDVKEILAAGLTGYVFGWVAKALLPAFIALALASRQYATGLALLAASVVLFGVTGFKGILIYAVIVPVCFWAIMMSRLHWINSLMTIVLVSLAGSLFLWLNSGVPGPATIFGMRGFVVTAQNHIEYFEFFTRNEYTYWSNSFLRHFVESRYEMKIPEIIGFGRYQKDQIAFANTGFIASGFMHAGILGVVIYSIGVGVVAKAFDVLVVNRVPLSVGLTLAFSASVQLVSADLPQAILSHGIGVSLLVLYLVWRTKWNPLRGDRSVYRTL